MKERNVLTEILRFCGDELFKVGDPCDLQSIM